MYPIRFLIHHRSQELRSWKGESQTSLEECHELVATDLPQWYLRLVVLMVVVDRRLFLGAPEAIAT